MDKLSPSHQFHFNFQTILKCKPFTVLSAVPSHSSPNVKLTRRSSRISSANENVMEAQQNTTSNGERSIGKPKSQNSVQCSSEGHDEDVVVRKKKSQNKRRSQNRIQSSDDDDDDFVTPKTKSPKTKGPKTKSPKSKKRRTVNSVRSEDEAVIVPKRKTPVKSRNPLLTIKCNKITHYFGKAAKTTKSEGKVLRINRTGFVYKADGCENKLPFA